VVFTAQSSNATICFIIVVGILYVGGYLNRVAGGMRGLGGGLVYALYFAIPHLEWYDIHNLLVHDWEGIGWLTMAGATLYGALYTGFFLGLAWMIFRRKTLTL
jgi:hypothetical protein